MKKKMIYSAKTLKQNKAFLVLMNKLSLVAQAPITESSAS